MDRPISKIKQNEMTKLLDKLNTIGFLFGSKDIWFTDVKLSSRFIFVFKKFEYIIDIINVFYTLSVLGSFFTQNTLSKKQATDRLMFSIILPGNMILYYISVFYKHETRNLLYHLVVVLKERQNDADLEREMIMKIKVFSMSLSGLACIGAVSFGLHALYRVLIAGENFIVIISAWPDVHDTSLAAGVMRAFFYLWWFPYAARIMFTFVMLVTMMLAICYQFKNLQMYFYSLEDIFSDRRLSQAEKEVKYELAFRVGIQMHSQTLWCKKQHLHVGKEMFAVEILLFFGMLLTELTTLLVVLFQNGARNLAQLCTMVLMSISTCLSFGFFMWNGGDITIEAAKLSDAMYSSGWHNCYGKSSVRIRKLVVNAMRQAQEPVVYKAFGVVSFSYESYVTLVKMPYTAVSVFY